MFSSRKARPTGTKSPFTARRDRVVSVVLVKGVVRGSLGFCGCSCCFVVPGISKPPVRQEVPATKTKADEAPECEPGDVVVVVREQERAKLLGVWGSFPRFSYVFLVVLVVFAGFPCGFSFIFLGFPGGFPLFFGLLG